MYNGLYFRTRTCRRVVTFSTLRQSRRSWSVSVQFSGSDSRWTRDATVLQSGTSTILTPQRQAAGISRHWRIKPIMVYNVFDIGTGDIVASAGIV